MKYFNLSTILREPNRSSLLVCIVLAGIAAGFTKSASARIAFPLQAWVRSYNCSGPIGIPRGYEFVGAHKNPNGAGYGYAIGPHVGRAFDDATTSEIEECEAPALEYKATPVLLVWSGPDSSDVTSYAFYVYEGFTGQWIAVSVSNDAHTTVAALVAYGKSVAFMSELPELTKGALDGQASTSAPPSLGGSGGGGGPSSYGSDPPGGYDPWAGVSINVVGTQLPMVTIEKLYLGK